MAETQNYKNHARFYAPYHFVLVPILFFHFIYSVVRLFQTRDVDHLEAVLLAVGLLLVGLLFRENAKRVQDRVIRLEENVRYAQLLPAEQARQVGNLKLNQILALRFASDYELPTLLQRVLNGELQKSADIKQAITNWRGDHLRV